MSGPQELLRPLSASGLGSALTAWVFLSLSSSVSLALPFPLPLCLDWPCLYMMGNRVIEKLPNFMISCSFSPGEKWTFSLPVSKFPKKASDWTKMCQLFTWDLPPRGKPGKVRIWKAALNDPA